MHASRGLVDDYNGYMKEAEELERNLEKLGKYSDMIDETVRLERENDKLQYRVNILRRTLARQTCFAVELLGLVRQLFNEAIMASAKCNWAPAIKDVSTLPPASIQRYKQRPNAEEENVNTFDFQCNSAFHLAPLVRSRPNVVAEQIADCLNRHETLDRVLCTGGFINVSLRASFVTDLVQRQLQYMYDFDGQVMPLLRHEKRPLKVIIDYGSPNIAKEMHVGHLRSSIIGESIARLMRFLGHQVLPLNHLGDWGTQFGMLITNLQDIFPDYLKNPPPLSDLVRFYKEAKARFDTDDEFKRRSLDAVVRLQNHEAAEIEAWKLLCAISTRSFHRIFRALDVNLVDRGESFYQEMMGPTIEELEKKNLIAVEDGCKVLHVDEKRPPLLVQKSDGGYTYDTSDLAAIRQRIFEEKGDVILYVVDIGQSLHLTSIFQAATKAGWLDPIKHRVEHVGFGLVLGEDGKKFKTRSGETVCLGELLDVGLERARQKLLEKERHLELSDQELTKAEKAVAYGCIKYADLSHNRLKDYVFSFDRMLSDKGNTAVYILYCYTRIQSILRKSAPLLPQENALRDYSHSPDFTVGDHPRELALAKQLLLYPDVLRKASEDLLMHSLCEYMYELAGCFTDFYDKLYCVNKEGDKVTIVMHRLALCELTAAVFRLFFSILGLEPLEKM